MRRFRGGCCAIDQGLDSQLVPSEYRNVNNRIVGEKGVTEFQLPEGLHIRPSRDNDKGFLESLHRSTREDLRQIDGEKDFIESLIEMQFRAQTEGYSEKFPNAMYFIIEKHGERIGKVTLNFGVDEIRIVEIAFIPEARGRGLGESVIQSLMVCAKKVRAPLTLAVFQQNIPAKRLYHKLGFFVDQICPPYELMSWFPPEMRKSVFDAH